MAVDLTDLILKFIYREHKDKMGVAIPEDDFIKGGDVDTSTLGNHISLFLNASGACGSLYQIAKEFIIISTVDDINDNDDTCLYLLGGALGAIFDNDKSPCQKPIGTEILLSNLFKCL